MIDLPRGVTADPLDIELDDVAPTPEHDDSPTAVYPLLSDLLGRPELLASPAVVIPRSVWRGRCTGLVAPDKAGKSTLAAQAVAAHTRADWWLGERIDTPGRAVIVAPDEATGDTVRRLSDAEAEPSRVRVLALRPPDLLGSLDALLREWPADVVVVDSLAEWARLTLGAAPDDGDASGWGSVVRPLVALTREHDCGMLLLHHPRRSDGQYRGSGEIAAALDCLLEMRRGQPTEDPTLRRISGRARWPIEDYAVRLDGEQYVLGTGGPVTIDARVVLDVTQHPGTSRAASHDRLGGRKQSHLAAIGRLVEDGSLIDRGGSLYLPGQVEDDLL